MCVIVESLILILVHVLSLWCCTGNVLPRLYGLVGPSLLLGPVKILFLFYAEETCLLEIETKVMGWNRVCESSQITNLYTCR